MSWRARSLSSNRALPSTVHGDALITTTRGCIVPRRRRVIASVSHDVAAENPPLNPGPHSQVFETIDGRMLVITVESPTYSTCAFGWCAASASFAAGVCGFETEIGRASCRERGEIS